MSRRDGESTAHYVARLEMYEEASKEFNKEPKNTSSRGGGACGVRFLEPGDSGWDTLD